MQAAAVSVLNGLVTAASLVVPQGSASAAAQFTSLTSTPTVLYIRRDNGDRNNVVNVFDDKGAHLYTLERQGRLSKLWSMYAMPSRIQVALITAGLGKRSIDFIGKPGIQHRELNAEPGILSTALGERKFYLNDGAPYVWTRQTQYLERIVNLGGGSEEIHQRLGQARLMRRFKFDYELLLDPSIDIEAGIATAFLSMLTQWALSVLTSAPGAKTLVRSDATASTTAGDGFDSGSGSQIPSPTPSPSSLPIPVPALATVAQSEAQAIAGLSPSLLVYEPKERKENFFNPPDFLNLPKPPKL